MQSDFHLTEFNLGLFNALCKISDVKTFQRLPSRTLIYYQPNFMESVVFKKKYTGYDFLWRSVKLKKEENTYDTFKICHLSYIASGYIAISHRPIILVLSGKRTSRASRPYASCSPFPSQYDVLLSVALK